ncbi:MAG: hypothetical protein ACLQVX_13025 [Limisphaerales bacterium]
METAEAGHERRDRLLPAYRAKAATDPPPPGRQAEFRNPVSIITKNFLVTRDIDLLKELAAAGASFAGTEIMRLPLTVAPIFQAWLERNVPERKDKVLNRIRDIRGGRINDPRFGHRMGGEGNFAEQIFQMFRVARRRAGLVEEGPTFSVAAFGRAKGVQAQMGLGL